MCTGDSELVLGYAYGLRQWSVALHPEMGLAGHNNHWWSLSGTNHAVCSRRVGGYFGRKGVVSMTVKIYQTVGIHSTLRHFTLQFFDQYPTAASANAFVVNDDRLDIVLKGIRSPEDITDLPERLLLRETPFDLHLQSTLPKTDDGHQVVDPECTCGFYAYTDPDSLFENSNGNCPTTFGLIRVSGRVTQGTKGFRAEKAEILALTELHRPTRPELDYLLAGRGSPISINSWVPDMARDSLDVPDHIQMFEDLPNLLSYAAPYLKETRD